MIWLAVLAIVVVALVILGLSVYAVARRLPDLNRAARRAIRRQADVEVLQMSIAHLQEHAQATAERVNALAQEASQARAKAATLRSGARHG